MNSLVFSVGDCSKRRQPKDEENFDPSSPQCQEKNNRMLERIQKKSEYDRTQPPFLVSSWLTSYVNDPYVFLISLYVHFDDFMNSKTFVQ